MATQTKAQPTNNTSTQAVQKSQVAITDTTLRVKDRDDLLA